MTIPIELQTLQSRLNPLETEEHRAHSTSSSARPAAVLILLFSQNGELHLVLTVRPDSLPRHPGQIALPGGAAADSDASLWHTALREAQEEIGYDGQGAVLLGRLANLHVTVSNYLVAPFVAWDASIPQLTPDPEEVADIFTVPLSLLTNHAAIEQEIWEFAGANYEVAYYRFGQHRIWGATARILSDLAARLSTAAERTGPLPGSVLRV